MHEEPFGYQVVHHGYHLTSCPGMTKDIRHSVLRLAWEIYYMYINLFSLTIKSNRNSIYLKKWEFESYLYFLLIIVKKS